MVVAGPLSFWPCWNYFTAPARPLCMDRNLDDRSILQIPAVHYGRGLASSRRAQSRGLRRRCAAIAMFGSRGRLRRIDTAAGVVTGILLEAAHESGLRGGRGGP